MLKTRRRAVLGAGPAFLWDAVCSCRARAEAQELARGCVLDEVGARNLLRTSAGAQLFATGNEPLVKSSGDRGFDYALAQTLSRISDKLGVLPGFAFYDDGAQRNAYASPYVRLVNSDGTVLFGLNFLRGIMGAPEHPDVRVTGVCAHEFGHIVQYKRRLDRVLMQGQPTVKRLELHADFLSGYYAGRRKLERPDYPSAEFALMASNIGDAAFNDPNHHGTADERSGAVVEGFKTAHDQHKSVDEAIQIGVAYVSRL